MLVTLVAVACDSLQPEDHLTVEQISFSEIEGWQDDDHSKAREAFLRSCEKRKELSPSAGGEKSQIIISDEAWGNPCLAAEKTVDAPQTGRMFFEHYFVPFVVSNRDNRVGLFTGYYEPLLYGSHVKRGDFQYPVYGKPKDLKEGVPYLTREQIDILGLEKKAPVLAWVDDPAMLFFLHVQGSGRIRFTDGKDVEVGFAGRNGHPYQSIGKVMRDEGLLEDDQLDFFGIRQWLYKHPDKAQSMMWRNPSYIFFRKLEQKDGPIGASGVALTSGRSLAVDKRFIPYGVPLFLQTELPAGPGRETSPFNHVVIAQDTGAAIRGPVRGDIFFGYGDDAEYYAGRMKSQGKYIMLVPKGAVAQLQSQ